MIAKGLCVPPHTYTGETFASGSADKQVVLWSNDELKGILKYSHSDPIQSLQYNPVSQLLLSCTTSEVGEGVCWYCGCLCACVCGQCGCLCVGVWECGWRWRCSRMIVSVWECAMCMSVHIFQGCMQCVCVYRSIVVCSPR